MVEDIHKRIINELERRRAIAVDSAVARKLDAELKYENDVIRHPTKGVWVLTDFGLHIDSRLDLGDIGRNLPRRDGLKHQLRTKYENRGKDLKDTKISHILWSLKKHEGGATTAEILPDVWFLTSSGLYSYMENLTAKGRGHKKVVSKNNETVNYFKELLRWPSLEPIVEFREFEPDPISFKRYTRSAESLGDIVRSAMKYGFKVTFVPATGKDLAYYAIALPETIGERKSLQYDPNRSQHFGILQLKTHGGLSTKLKISESDAIDIAPAALELRINDYGKRYFEQRLGEARAYRQRIGLEKLV